MKNLVILGCTGSIGTQALEIVAASDELRVVGLGAGSSWEATLEQAGRHGVGTVALADPAAAERARPAWERHRALRRGGGAGAGRRQRRRPRPQRHRRRRRAGADDRRPQRGHRRRPRQQGEPGDRGRADDGARRGLGLTPSARRLRALGPLPADRSRAAGDDRAARADRLRGPLPGSHRPRRGLGRGGARPPDLADGGADHDRLCDADEQGLRGDRGAPSLRRGLRADRGRRPPAVDRPLAGRSQRRSHARPPRPARHEGADLLRPPSPAAGRRRRAAGSTWRRWAS